MELKATHALMILAVLLLASIAFLLFYQNFMAGGRVEYAASTSTTLAEVREAAAAATTLPLVIRDMGLVAAEGDVVTVHYVIWDEDGVMYDTSYQELANKTVAYMLGDDTGYGPVTFEVGSGTAIEGLETGVIGMSVGDSRTLTIEPLKAYGLHVDEYVFLLSRTERIPRYQSIARDIFERDIGSKPALGGVYTLSKNMSSVDWPITVVNLSGDSVYIEYGLPSVTSFETNFGPAVIEETGDEFHVIVSPSTGRVVTKYGIARITDVNEENFTLDYNNELANKTIVVKVDLLDIMRASGTGLSTPQ
ncbi:MAG: FKBP-type peptidyl-prolyl cis-trans isomerase [Candidatus Altiarchaeota archaeon]